MLVMVGVQIKKRTYLGGSLGCGGRSLSGLGGRGLGCDRRLGRLVVS